MLKFLVVFILYFVIIDAAFAQKDSSVYYIKKSGKLVSTADSADYTLSITPPDPGTDRNLFVLKERYHNGKIRFISGSLTNKLEQSYPNYPGYFKPVLQGSYISFFPNGNIMAKGDYENGDQVGDQLTYYPNGKLYTSKTYSKNKKVISSECRDSTGKVLVENGNGKWLTFIDENFKNYVKGEVTNGLQEGDWNEKIGDRISTIYNYKHGDLISTATLDNGEQLTYSRLEVVPEFPGGVTGFGKFLSNNINYPKAARKAGIQGMVIVSFVSEKDGTLADIKVVKSIGGGCDEEAARVVKLSPPWKSGMHNGQPVRVAYSVPINFTLTGNK